MLKSLISCCLLLLLVNAANGDIVDYGQLPEFRSLSISPDGEHYAYIERGDKHDLFVVREVKSKKNIYSGLITAFKARNTQFISNEHVLLHGSDTTQTFGYRGYYENSGALVYNISSQKIKVLLRDTKGLYPAQSGLGRIVGVNLDKQQVYMPAFAKGSKPPRHLYRVSLKTGRGRIHDKGNSHTLSWFVGKRGRVLAREEYHKDDQEHLIRSKLSGKWQVVYRSKTAIPEMNVVAVTQDAQSLLFIDKNDDRNAIYSLSLVNGAIDGPIYAREDADIDDINVDINGQVVALIYSGFTPSYEFINPEMSQLYARLSNTFANSSVYLSSWSKDLKHSIVLVSGNENPGTYYSFDRDKVVLTKLASQYDVAEVGEIKAVRYKARDGLKIPAILTLPPGPGEKTNLPLIALPHGGPEAYDRIGFDWMAQFFAAKGYAVLQPNFRGSTGFGVEFRDAGRGRWGREMQDDVTDGVELLVKAGYVDPSRVCIVGASYGGYSALAGGAFSPELYRCVVAIAAVTDLPKMLASVRYRRGRNHWVLSYWNKVMGDPKSQADKLEAISPARFAANFQAPVLLIHGKDDTIVPVKQSKLMYKALQKLGKPVEFITLDGEDHWLSTSPTRLQMLTAIEKFLDIHNPVTKNRMATKQPDNNLTIRQ